MSKSKYDPKMIKKIDPLMSEGASLNELCAELNITKETLNQWLKVDGPYYKGDKFYNAVQHGRMLSEVWWEKQGRLNLKNKEFNATLWYMNMKNRHGWRDTQEHKVDASVTVNIVRFGANDSNDSK